jgi:thiol-disulfide isomerase/thioredoxin
MWVSQMPSGTALGVRNSERRISMYRRILMIVVLLTVGGSPLFAASGQVVNVTPQQPKVGDKIGVVYDAGVRTAILVGVKSVTLNALVLRNEAMPNLLEIALKKSGKTWKGSFTLDDDKAQAILFKFVTGDKTDDNNGNCWDLLVYGDNGKPVKGAWMWRGQLEMYGGGYGFKKTKDVDAGIADLRKETTLYPDNATAYGIIWSAQLRATPGDETKASIKAEVWTAYENLKDKSNTAGPFLSMMERLGQKDLADSLRKTLVAANPKGKVAEGMKLNAVYAEKDPAKKEDLFKAYLADFPKKGDEAKTLEDNVNQSLLYSYISALEYDKAAGVLETMSQPSGDIYNTLAWSIIEKGEKGPEMDKAVGWAKRGIDIMKEDKAPKPSYMSDNDWKRNKAMSLGMISDTYAFGLFKSGRTEEAETAYEEAVKLTEWKQEDVNERYLDACVFNGHYEKGMSVGSEMIKKGNTSDKVMENYRTAYTKVKGSDKGFDEIVTNAKNAAADEARKTIMKERVNKPAVNFTLKDIDGKTVRLADLRGKVVVVDFWATWCGPCKASFPFLQKVYEKYKDNPSVKILAFNTWENVTGAKREELVKKFMSENKYTFPVVYDEGYVDRYGVEGIPTKFIIDKKGNVQFKSVGFISGQKMTDEMIMEIDMLLGDEFYSVN